MIDSDLAELYNVETKNLKRAVRSNIERFPDDFMFETKEEYESLRCNFFTLNKNGRGQHSKYLPFAFTQEGIAMLSGLLRSSVAIQVNNNIMRAFVQMRQALLTINNAQLQLEQIRSEVKQLRLDMEETLHDQLRWGAVAPQPRLKRFLLRQQLERFWVFDTNLRCCRK